MTALQYDSFHRLLENYARELPLILDRHVKTQKLVPVVQRGLKSSKSPFTVAVVGQMRVGKSSLLNALVEADLAVTGVNETTATINWFKYGEGERCERFRVIWKDRPEEEFPRDEIDKWIGNSERARNTLRLEFFAKADFLETAYIVDTPGTRSVHNTHENATQNFIADKQDVEKTDSESREQGDRADAIIYVFPPVARETDQELLRSFQDSSRIQNAAPYNSVAVVHKWETLESPDPYDDVQKKVDRIKDSFSSYVAEVLPVSAPMGWASEHYGDEFWQAVYDLGKQSVDVLEEMLLSPEDFTMDVPGCTISTEHREALRAKFKLPWKTLEFIIRRVGIGKVKTPQQLKDLIREISGVPQLRDMLKKRFFSRSKMIRGFSVLAKTLPACAEASQRLRNHKQIYSALLEDVDRVLKGADGSTLPSAIREYILETRTLVDLTVTSDTLKALDTLVQPIKDAFEEMNNDVKYLDQLGLLNKYAWGADWKPKLARLFGQSGPELRSRLSGIVPNVSPDDLEAAIKQLNTALSELSNLRFQASGEAKNLLQHAHERLCHLLDEIEES